MDEIAKLAVELHGHLAPGIALGIRMSNIALEKLGANRGNRKLIAVSETYRCLADAMQAATGCTLGHGNAFVYNYGKLALMIGRADTGDGIRVALKEDAHGHSQLMRKWMMREGRLTHAEEEELGRYLLSLREEHFDIKQVKLNLKTEFNASKIAACGKCGDLVPEDFLVDGACGFCAGGGYYTSSR